MLWWLVDNTIVAGLLAAAVCLGCRVRRFGPAVCHALWLVVLVRLMAPPLIDWPWSIPFQTARLPACGAWCAGFLETMEWSRADTRPGHCDPSYETAAIDAADGTAHPVRDVESSQC